MRLLALMLHRLAWFAPTLLGLLVVTFFISRVIPADPVALVAGETATPAQVEELRRQLGYDRPLPVQFVQYVGRLVRGDMGTSIFTRRPIVEDLTHRLPATIELTIVAMVFSIVIGIPLGVLSALWRNSPLTMLWPNAVAEGQWPGAPVPIEVNVLQHPVPTPCAATNSGRRCDVRWNPIPKT